MFVRAESNKGGERRMFEILIYDVIRDVSLVRDTMSCVVSPHTTPFCQTKRK